MFTEYERTGKFCGRLRLIGADELLEIFAVESSIQLCLRNEEVPEASPQHLVNLMLHLPEPVEPVLVSQPFNVIERSPHELQRFAMVQSR